MSLDSHRSVAELIDSCLQRPADEAAWQEFVRRFHPTIHASVNRTLGLIGGYELKAEKEIVEEIIQSVYLRLIEKGSLALRESDCSCADSMRNYLAMLAVTIVRDRFRHRNLDRPN
ncbi:MAG TPA: hypothetical protein VID27_20965 [Blastocatellia bacterium]|jgi:RNA polymerase sigma-70 factor (ECF subfamily)